jgi:hypothetical protein
VKVGDSVEIDLLDGARRTVSLPVTALVEDYFGIKGMMDAEALARLMRERPVVNSINLSLIRISAQHSMTQSEHADGERVGTRSAIHRTFDR